MPRPRAGEQAKTVQITFRVPDHLPAVAEIVARLLSSPGFEATPQDAYRAAMERGFQELLDELPKRSGPFYRVSAWDGVNTTCLFFIGRDKNEALNEAESLAAKHADGPWTVMRVYEGDKKNPIKQVMVKR